MNILEFEVVTNRDKRHYIFNTSNYYYKVFFTRNDFDNNRRWISFKAKKINEADFFYDSDCITNDNLYLVMNTIIEILKEEKEICKNKLICFTTNYNNKGKQRFELYKRFLDRNNCEYEIDYDYDNSIIIK